MCNIGIKIISEAKHTAHTFNYTTYSHLQELLAYDGLHNVGPIEAVHTVYTKNAILNTMRPVATA